MGSKLRAQPPARSTGKPASPPMRAFPGRTGTGSSLEGGFGPAAPGGAVGAGCPEAAPPASKCLGGRLTDEREGLCSLGGSLPDREPGPSRGEFPQGVSAGTIGN